MSDHEKQKYGIISSSSSSASPSCYHYDGLADWRRLLIELLWMPLFTQLILIEKSLAKVLPN